MIYLSTNDITSLSFNDICNGAVSLGLYPPSTITDGNSNTYDQNNPLDNTGTSGPILRGDGKYECSDDNFYARDDSDEGRLQMNFITGDTNLAQPPIASEYWRLKQDGTQMAVFDVAAANPFDSNSDPIAYMPALKVTVDGSDVITRIDVKWYRYDPDSSQYVEVVDETVMSGSMDGGGITLDDYSGTNGNGGQRIEEHNSNGESGNTVVKSWTTFNRTWYFTGNATQDDAVADSITLNYSMSGVSFRFVWRN